MKGNGRALKDVPVIGDITPYLILIWLAIQIVIPLIRAGYRFIRDLEKPRVKQDDVKRVIVRIGSAVLAGGVLIGGMYAIGRLILFR